MNLLLDTHVFLWCVLADQKLTKKAKDMISQADQVYISSASIWELTIKKGLKKWEGDIEELLFAISASGFSELPVKNQHAVAVLRLQDLHRDPFDRLLIAQAISEPLVFLTADKQLEGYSSLVTLI